MTILGLTFRVKVTIVFFASGLVSYVGYKILGTLLLFQVLKRLRFFQMRHSHMNCLSSWRNCLSIIDKF